MHFWRSTTYADLDQVPRYENRIVLTIVELIDLGLIASFDVQPCAIHSPFALLATPPIWIRRVESSMRKRTINRCRPFGLQTSMVKKSDATICSQCRVRNSCQVVFRLRSGAGSMPWAFRMLAM